VSLRTWAAEMDLAFALHDEVRFRIGLLAQQKSKAELVSSAYREAWDIMARLLANVDVDYADREAHAAGVALTLHGIAQRNTNAVQPEACGGQGLDGGREL
jgi:hypothetical protein